MVKPFSVLAIWRPYVGSPLVRVPSTTSTNDEVLQHAGGARVRAGHQSAEQEGGEGSSRATTPETQLASWLVGSGPDGRTRDP